MTVASTDIKLYLSGGSGNTDPNASIGGAISTTQVSATALNNLFDNVSDAEALAGDTNYRCVFVKNTHATDALTAAKAYILSNTPSSDTTDTIGLDPAGLSAAAATPANEATAPSGVTFVAAANLAGALSIGTMAAGVYQAIWIKRVVSAAASPVSTDPMTLRITGTP